MTGENADNSNHVLEIPEGLRHLAIIMDGNGRWANSRGLRRTRGHKEGAGTVRRITTLCAEAGLEELTLYALSVENYVKRPRHEVEFLLALLKRFVIRERATIMDNNIQFRTLGRTEEFPRSVRHELEKLRDLSSTNDGMTLRLALNYGGRSEIADAAKCIALDVKEGRLAVEDVDEQTIQDRLYDPLMPDVDLLVRTAGELRVSNFLLWQISYGEIFVCDTYWPDFGNKDMTQAMLNYGSRNRKFGGLVRPVDA